MAQTDSSAVGGVQEFVPDKLAMLGLQRIQLNKRSFVLNHPLYIHSILTLSVSNVENQLLYLYYWMALYSESQCSQKLIKSRYTTVFSSSEAYLLMALLD